MCTILYTPAGVKPITPEMFDRQRRRVGKTIGVMWHHHRKVRTLKSNDNLAESALVYAQYVSQVKKGRPAVLHFRAGGPIENCQPFTAWQGRLGYALNHSVRHYAINLPTWNWDTHSYLNPTASGVATHAALAKAGNRSPSDAAAFGLGFLDNLPVHDLGNPDTRKAIENEVPRSSKMAFMDRDGDVYLVGTGYWSDDGHWNSGEPLP